MSFFDSFFIYFVVIFISLSLLYISTKVLFTEQTSRANILATSLVGNTGNLGIPLGIALLGEASVIYTSIINLANLIFIYTFSVYFFAGAKFNIKESFKAIAKIPIIWVSIFAIWFNLGDFHIHQSIQKPLEMGAYSAIILQLVIFGMFLSQIKFKEVNIKLVSYVSIIKMGLLPLVGYIILQNIIIEPFIASVLILELMMPLAVNNLNLAALYNVKPSETTLTIALSSLLFIIFSPIYIKLLNLFL